MSASFFSHDEKINAALALLRAHGYQLTRPELLPEETTMTELARKTGVSVAGIYQRLHAPHCPGWQATHRGPSGRVIRLRLSAEALAYVSRPLAPGKRGVPAPPPARRDAQDIFAGGCLSPIALATT